MFTVRSESTIQYACDALIEADRLTARALSIIGCVDCESVTGLPTEMMLVLGAPHRRRRAHARQLSSDIARHAGDSICVCERRAELEPSARDCLRSANRRRRRARAGRRSHREADGSPGYNGSRLLATIDIESLRKGAESDSSRILWSLAGRPARVTPLATDVLACDATVVPILFDGARPVAVGDATAAITSAMRTALIARDGGCRFPGCHAPVSWCDAHHIRTRIQDGPTVIDNLILLCRKCHRRVHRLRWKIAQRDDGVIEFTWHGTTLASSRHTPRRE